MKKFFLLCPLLISSILFANEKKDCFLGDLEGNIDSWKNIKKEIIEGGKLGKGGKFYFMGDAPDKGPGGMEIISDLVTMKKEFGDRFDNYLGNRDVNKVRIITELARYDSNPTEPRLVDDQQPFLRKDLATVSKCSKLKDMERAECYCADLAKIRPLTMEQDKKYDECLKKPPLSKWEDFIEFTADDATKFNFKGKNHDEIKVKQLQWTLQNTMGAGGGFEFRRDELKEKIKGSEIKDIDVYNSYLIEMGAKKIEPKSIFDTENFKKNFEGSGLKFLETGILATVTQKDGKIDFKGHAMPSSGDLLKAGFSTDFTGLKKYTEVLEANRKECLDSLLKQMKEKNESCIKLASMYEPSTGKEDKLGGIAVNKTFNNASTKAECIPLNGEAMVGHVPMKETMIIQTEDKNKSCLPVGVTDALYPEQQKGAFNILCKKANGKFMKYNFDGSKLTSFDIDLRYHGKEIKHKNSIWRANVCKNGKIEILRTDGPPKFDIKTELIPKFHRMEGGKCQRYSCRGNEIYIDTPSTILTKPFPEEKDKFINSSDPKYSCEIINEVAGASGTTCSPSQMSNIEVFSSTISSILNLWNKK